MIFSLSPFEGYNAIFAAMIFISLVYFAIASLTGIGGHEGGDMADGHGFDHDMDHDFGHDAHAEAQEAGESDHDHDHDHQSEESGGFLYILTGILNTEHKCPLTYAVFILLLIWGVTGYIINASLLKKSPEFFFKTVAILSHALSGIVALLITRKVAPMIARSIPSGKGASKSYKDFIGENAEVSTILHPQKEGMVAIDRGSAVIKVRARLTAQYSGPSLMRGAKVLLVVHLGDDLYECEPL